MDLYQAEAARGWYKWIYIGIKGSPHIRQRQPGLVSMDLFQRGSPGVGINGFLSFRGSPGLAEAAGVGINGLISGRGSPGLV